MKETTYELRTLNEIIQTIPDSYVSSDPNDSNMVYLRVGSGHRSNTHAYGLLRSSINTYLGRKVCLKVYHDHFEIKRLDGNPHTWKWSLRCLDGFIEIFCKTTKDFSFNRTCQSSLSATFEK